jgi:hypothetical protein
MPRTGAERVLVSGSARAGTQTTPGGCVRRREGFVSGQVTFEFAGEIEVEVEEAAEEAEDEQQVLGPRGLRLPRIPGRAKLG